MTVGKVTKGLFILRTNQFNLVILGPLPRAEMEISEEESKPGPFLIYFMVFNLFFFTVMLLPMLLFFITLMFTSVVGIPAGIRFVQSLKCLYSCKINPRKEIGDYGYAWMKRVKRNKALNIAVVWIYVIPVMTGLLFVMMFASICSFLLILLYPGFWQAGKRKGLRLSYLQAAAVMSNCTWSLFFITPCEGNWDLDKGGREKKPSGLPAKWKQIGVFIIFLVICIALPINDTLSDFLYSKTLLDLYLQTSNSELFPYVIVSFLASTFGFVVAVVTFARLAWGFRRAYLIEPKEALMYPFYQLELREDSTSPHQMRVRSYLFKFFGSVFEDLTQLVVLYRTGSLTSSASFSFIFSMATSILGMSLHWSDISTKLITMQAITINSMKFMIRLYVFVAFCGLMSFALLNNVASSLNLFCWVEHDYAPVLIEQYQTCPYLLTLVFDKYVADDLEVSLTTPLANISLGGNPSLQSFSFSEHLRAGFINITGNPHLKTVSFPRARVEVDADFEFVSFLMTYIVNSGIGRIIMTPKEYSRMSNPVGLALVNNPLLETFSVALLNCTTILIVDNPKLKNLVSSNSLFMGQLRSEWVPNYYDGTYYGLPYWKSGAYPAYVSIINNDSLENVTVEATVNFFVNLVGNAALETVTIISTDGLLTAYITSGPIPNSVESLNPFLVIGDNPSLIRINLPQQQYNASSTDFVVTAFSGVIAFADQEVFYP